MNNRNWLTKGLVLATALVCTTISGIGQTTVTFPFSGAATSWTVPNCVTSITVVVEGAQGGNSIDGAGSTGAAGTPIPGGEGAVVTATIPVSPGDIIGITVGGQGGIGTAGFNGGGTGNFSSDGQLVNGSAGGGGSSNVTVNGTPVIIAAGGGGGAGGSWAFGVENNGGGDGGCATGQAGMGSPWIGVGGGGGTQFAAGVGGAPWAGVPTGGFSGSMGTGGQGGIWGSAPGGGGGGGYFGGGGGGNDGCCTGANGAAGGGGGSSLTPGGGGCVQGANTGNGSVTITYTGGGPNATISDNTICEGETVTVDLVGATGTIQWQTAPTTAGPWVNIPGATTATYTTVALFADACFRAEETGGACTLTPYSNEVCVAVTIAPNPFAGLDDTICHSAVTGYVLQGAPAGAGTTSWSQFQGPLGTPAPPNTVYAPNSSNPNATILVNYPGLYTYVLSETDPAGVCPNATDTVSIFFANETHTTTFTNPVCDDAADGSITITSTGNLGAVLYSFDGGGSFGPSNTSGLTLLEGTYTVISQDAAGCTFQSTVTLTDPAPVVVSVSNDTTVCENGTATVSASATGGTTYNYHWSMTASLLPVQTVSPTVPTNVTVFAENEFGCVSTPLDIDILMHPPISLTITPNDTICPGYASNHVVSPTGGFMGYNYAWTANGVAMAGSTSIDINPTVQTAYCVTVSDGCETTPVVICTNTLMREVPNPIFTSDTTGGCVPTEIEFTNLTTLIAPAYIDSITWNIGGVMYFDTLNFTHEFTEIGTYDVWLEIYTNYGCYNSILVDDYITIHPQPEAMFYANPNPTTIFNTEVEFNDLSTPGNNTYQWTFGGGNPSNSIEDSPTVVYPEGYAANYPVTMIVTNEFMCSDTIQGIIEVQSDILIFVPNVFTPDGDEFNETWRVYIDGIDIYDFHLMVYNRWGEVVWESYNPEGAWDGTYGTTEAKSGTYVWVIEAKDKFSDKKVEWRGHVTVLK